MGLSPLLPIAGAALSSLTGKAMETIANGPSFLEVLQGSLGLGESSEAEKETAAEDVLSADELTTKLEAFVRKVQQKLAAARIEASLPIEMRSDGRGGIILDNPHPNRAAIEQILASDEELNAEFHRLAAGVAAASEQRDPLTSPDAEDFRLRLDQTGTEVSLV
ncbi:MAG: hypothetical protein ACC628_22715 [Pirellulaceae bacterium]